MIPLLRSPLIAVLAGLLLYSEKSMAQVTNFVNFEGKQTSPIRLSPDGTRLFAVNTPDSRLSVFDVSNPGNPVLIAEIPVGIEPVSVNPLNNDEAWVVNEVSDSISVVSVSRHIVTDTIYVRDEPADVVFANGRAFVSASRKNQVRVFDSATHADLATIPLVGENPRSMVVNSNETKIYVAFALSGNRTTLVPALNAQGQPLAPPQPPPSNPNLPAPPQVSLIVDATDPNWTNVVRYTMPDNDIAEIDTASMTVSRYFPRVATVNFSMAIHPVSGDLYVAATDARNLTHFEPNVRGSFVTNLVCRVRVSDGSVTQFDLNPGVNTNLMPNLPAKTNALAQPTAIVFGPSGNSMLVAAFGTDRIAKVDPVTGNVTARIDIGPAPGSASDPRNKRGPRGLALGRPGTQKLYVLNRLANSLAVVNLGSNTLERELPVGSFDPTPAIIRQGRGFLYDAKLSGAGVVSCASCHIDAENDLIAWDLGDPNGTMTTNRVTIAPGLPTTQSTFHPMKGPMTTQTLRGLRGLEPFHWRGDRTNFSHFNGAFDSLLGGSLLSPADMTAYTNFINTIVFQPNPNQNLDRTLPTTFPNGGNPAAGRNNFVIDQYTTGFSCNTCHQLPNGSTNAIIPAAALQESQDFKVPHLRSVYTKLNITHAPGATSVGGFGVTHDGTDPDLFTFLSRPVFRTFSTNTAIKRNLEAFVQCFDTGTAPAVGYARTLTSNNVDTAAIVNDWTLLEGQAATSPKNIDLIVKGTIDGKTRGLVYQPGSSNYRSDKTGLGPFTHAQLRAKIVAGDTLTVMGVPPGSGYRLGIDRDQDGVPDGDIPQPTLEIALASTNSLVAWPTNANGFVLERTPTLPSSSWSADTTLRGIAAGKFNVTNSVSQTNSLFFRLREL